MSEFLRMELHRANKSMRYLTNFIKYDKKNVGKNTDLAFNKAD